MIKILGTPGTIIAFLFAVNFSTAYTVNAEEKTVHKYKQGNNCVTITNDNTNNTQTTVTAFGCDTNNTHTLQTKFSEDAKGGNTCDWYTVNGKRNNIRCESAPIPRPN